MKQETADLYIKYMYFLLILSNERLILFNADNNHLNFDEFFHYYNDVILHHWLIKSPWKNYKKRRTQLIKKFEYGKYEILLRSKFCFDIKNLILSFMFK